MAQMTAGKAAGVPHRCLDGLGWIPWCRSHPPGWIQMLSERRSDSQTSRVSSRGPDTVLDLVLNPWSGEHWERWGQMAADSGGLGSRAHLSPTKASTWKFPFYLSFLNAIN